MDDQACSSLGADEVGLVAFVGKDLGPGESRDLALRSGVLEIITNLLGQAVQHSALLTALEKFNSRCIRGREGCCCFLYCLGHRYGGCPVAVSGLVVGCVGRCILFWRTTCSRGTVYPSI